MARVATRCYPLNELRALCVVPPWSGWMAPYERWHMARLGASVVLCLVLGASIGRAQDGSGEFKPSNDQVNKELDDSLRKEFEPPPPPPPPPPPVIVHHKDDRLKLTLGGMAAHMVAVLDDVTVSHRDHGTGGNDIDLDQVSDFDEEHTQTYRAWFEIGRHVALEGGYRGGVFRDTSANPTAFVFGRSAYAAGEMLDTKIETCTADLDLVLKPLNNRWIGLGIHLGARYMFWRTDLKGTGMNREESTLEAVVPVIGASIAFRPFKWWEIFARGRVGYLSYERDSGHYHHGDHDHYVEAKEKEAKSVELDVGMQFLIADTIGLIVGARLDYMDIEREVDAREESAKGTMKGVYAGLVLQF